MVIYIDDILVTGLTEEAHLSALKEVLKRLGEAGLRLKEKCVFLAPSVVYLGYWIDAEGIHPVSEKVKAIQEALHPTSVYGLKSYLGLLTCYFRFLPNLSTTLAPLYKLLKYKKDRYGQTSKRKRSSNRKNFCYHLSYSFTSTLRLRLHSLVMLQHTALGQFCLIRCQMIRKSLWDLCHER